jgi:hypothetical protein
MLYLNKVVDRAAQQVWNCVNIQTKGQDVHLWNSIRSLRDMKTSEQ